MHRIKLKKKKRTSIIPRSRSSLKRRLLKTIANLNKKRWHLRRPKNIEKSLTVNKKLITGLLKENLTILKPMLRTMIRKTKEWA